MRTDTKNAPAEPMSLPSQLSQRIAMPQIKRLAAQADAESSGEETLCRQLYRLIFSPHRRTAANAAWVLTHTSDTTLAVLHGHFAPMVEAAAKSDDDTLRRLLLTLLHRMPLPPDEEQLSRLYGLCTDWMMSRSQPSGVRSLAAKMACRIALLYPGLDDELRLLFDIMEPHQLPPALLSVRRRVMKAIEKRKSSETKKDKKRQKKREFR